MTRLTHLDAPTREDVLRLARDRGLKILAAFPYHYPRALVRAHGFHPMEVWAPPRGSVERGSRHFQAYACAIVVKGTGFLLEGGFDQVDAVLVPHGCDALQGLGSVLTDFVTDRPPMLTLYPPRGRRDVDARYLRAEFDRLAGELARISGHIPTREDWAAAFAAEDAADAALARLYDRRGEWNLTDRQFYSVLRLREYVLAEQFVEIVDALPVRSMPRTDTGPGLLLSGILADPLDVFDVIAEAGARVVADDLGTGSRRLLAPSTLDDPLDRCVDAFMRGPADPTRADPLGDRVSRLIDLLRSTGARGVLVLDPTFCEPEQFYLPRLRRALEEQGVPMLVVEHEATGTIDGRTRSRIEAFVETLTHGVRS